VVDGLLGTPVIATYVPEEVSTNWEKDWIMHDSHGGRMFEDMDVAKDHINPDSLKPESANPSKYKSEFKSMEPKSPDYHDSPEYRKSLHLQGKEKEEILAKLRQRLGIRGRVGQVSKDVKHHEGVDTGSNLEIKTEPKLPTITNEYSSYTPKTEAAYQSTSYASYQSAAYETSEAYSTSESYSTTEAYTESEPYVETTSAPYVETTYAASELTTAPYGEPPRYEQPEMVPESAEAYRK